MQCMLTSVDRFLTQNTQAKHAAVVEKAGSARRPSEAIRYVVQPRVCSSLVELARVTLNLPSPLISRFVARYMCVDRR